MASYQGHFHLLSPESPPSEPSSPTQSSPTPPHVPINLAGIHRPTPIRPTAAQLNETQETPEVSFLRHQRSRSTVPTSTRNLIPLSYPRPQSQGPMTTIDPDTTDDEVVEVLDVETVKPTEPAKQLQAALDKQRAEQVTRKRIRCPTPPPPRTFSKTAMDAYSSHLFTLNNPHAVNQIIRPTSIPAPQAFATMNPIPQFAQHWQPLMSSTPSTAPAPWATATPPTTIPPNKQDIIQAMISRFAIPETTDQLTPDQRAVLSQYEHAKTQGTAMHMLTGQGPARHNPASLDKYLHLVGPYRTVPWNEYPKYTLEELASFKQYQWTAKIFKPFIHLMQHEQVGVALRFLRYVPYSKSEIIIPHQMRPHLAKLGIGCSRIEIQTFVWMDLEHLRLHPVKSPELKTQQISLLNNHVAQRSNHLKLLMQDFQ